MKGRTRAGGREVAEVLEIRIFFFFITYGLSTIRKISTVRKK